MATLKEAVRRDLKEAGVDDPNIQEKVAESIDRNLPKKTYELAVWFLGMATILLILGAVAAVLLDKTTPDAFWVAVGAGLGALAGIFTGKG